MKKSMFKSVAFLLGILFFSSEGIAQNQTSVIPKNNFYRPKEQNVSTPLKKANADPAPAPYVVDCMSVETNDPAPAVKPPQNAPKIAADKPRVAPPENIKKD
jgi:hypothetical protein